MITPDLRTSTDPRVNIVQRSNGVDPRKNNIDLHYVDPRALIGVNRNQNVSAESNRLNPNTPSTPRLSNDSHTSCDPRLVSSVNVLRAHNGLIIRPNVATMNHHDIIPYRHPIQRNMIPDDSNNTIEGVTNVVDDSLLILLHYPSSLIIILLHRSSSFFID